MHLAPLDVAIGQPRPEESMAKSEERRSGTYRCPVCGHRDTADLPAGHDSMVIACSYCHTPLEISSRGLDSLRFSVQVSEQPAAS
jgi:transcription elongation factor Elf1